MANILPPGYLKWDGSKYILDPGTSGSISGDAGGDLSGTYPDPVVAKVNGTTITDTPSANQVLTSLNGTSAAWSEIVNAHVGASAAIEGTKIDPDFGAQNVETTGSITGNSIVVGSGVNAPTVTSGAGAPVSTPQEGSVYLRINGDADTAIYVYQDAAWSPVGGGGGGFTAGGDLTGSSSSQTIDKIQGTTLVTASKAAGDFIRYDGSQWLSVAADSIDLAGDLDGNVTAAIVIKANGATIPTAGSLITGNILQVSGASALSYGPLNLAGGSNYVTGTLPLGNLPDATTGAKGIVQLAGDLAGTATSVTVSKINGTTVPAGGTLATGQILRVSGASALTYGALDLANAIAVTGILPVANLPDATTGAKGIVQLAGDIAGTSTAVVVSKINGTTVPAGGSLTTGNGLYVSGVGALTYGPLNLAGGSNYVTGALPAGNLPDATTGAKGIVQLAGDIGGTAAAPTVVDLTITSEATGSMIYFNGSNWVNRAAGTANYILTANGAAAPTWNNSITAMTDIRSNAWGMEIPGGTNGKSEILFDYFTTTSNTQYTARTITLAASKAYLITVNLWGSDGYTGYGGSYRTLHVVKAGKYYRGPSGGAILSGFSSVQDLTPSWGESPTIDLSLVISTNDIQIKVTGQSTFNAKWIMETSVRQVSI